MLVIYLNFSNGLAVGRGILEIVNYDQRLLLFKEMAVSGTQHPLVEDILERKLLSRKSKWALPWAILNFVVAILFYCDLNQGSVSRFFQGNLPFIWHTEFILAIVFTLNGMYDLWVYAWPVLGQSPLELSPVHRKLFNVQENDVGFKHSPASSSSPSPEPKGRSPKLTSFVLPSSPHSSNLSSSPSLLSSTPLDYSAYSWQSSSLGSSPNNSLLSTSWTYFGNPPANQYRPLGEETVLRHRWESSLHSTPQDSTSPVSSFWNYPHSSVPFTPVLHKNQYQIATRSPQSATSHDDDPDSPTMHSGERIWNKLKISEDQLTAWISNLRKWISQTILVKVVSEIEAVNDDLRRLGSAEVGEGSLSNLRQVALTTGQHLHSLNGLILYLDITSNQEYLVQRLKELAKGGCMSEFRWNSGGSFKGKPWSDHLPTDSAIVMHLFGTYMDSRLPPDPHYPDGKTFTSQYFKKTPDKPVGKDVLCIYQSRVNPPYYKVITGEVTWDFPKGRNNMFFAMLFFLHHIKTKQCGMLGRVNLGLSGINILWVIDT